MESQSTRSEGVRHSFPVTDSAAAAVNTSCRKKKSEASSFLEDLRDHMDEFVHASMDEHKISFKNTIQKMFGMTKIVAERSRGTEEAKGVESSLPLRTTVSLQ